METILYLSVKTVSVAYILYKVWNMIYSKRMDNFWDILYNWARIARIKWWRYRKKRMAEKARNARRKAIMPRPLVHKEQPQKQPKEQVPEFIPYSEMEIKAILDAIAKDIEDKTEDESLLLPIEEKPEPKIKPVVFDDPNEVMGKSNIVYYEDPEIARKTPTRSIPLKEVELPVDKDINPEDVEDNFIPQKKLSEEDSRS